jgi:hypothetical protein
MFLSTNYFLNGMNYTIYVEINMYIKEEKEKKGGEN